MYFNFFSLKLLLTRPVSQCACMQLKTGELVYIWNFKTRMAGEGRSGTLPIDQDCAIFPPDSCHNVRDLIFAAVAVLIIILSTTVIAHSYAVYTRIYKRICMCAIQEAKKIFIIIIIGIINNYYVFLCCRNKQKITGEMSRERRGERKLEFALSLAVSISIYFFIL